MNEALTKIHYAKPSITDLEVHYAADAAAHGWGEQCYAYIARFETAFAEFTGAAHAIATSSATGALHMGMAALGIGPGDEVILADTNWIASVAPIVHLGATPVFVDILSDSWCLDPQQVERAITPKTKAILAVHLYGNLCDMDRLERLAHKHELLLIEDAAEALGSRWQGHHTGTLGRFGAFSFHGTKTITTGEGGMFVTNDDALYENVLTLSNHGRARGEKRQFWASKVGFKYKMSNIEAAIGCAQLERVDELLARRREIFLAYKERLADIPDLAMNPEPPGTVNGFWMPTVVFPPRMGDMRRRLLDAFRQRRIDGRVFFHPLSGLDMFPSRPENHNSWDIPSRAVNLPCYHDLNMADIDRVATVVREQCRAASGS
ncbi:DegT/DnrJ/EryC1/StrS family aminotransferase [Solidesulfovibrio sp.]|uniref:DegT/DnrJ/EryC1/StrS family aminotransferase n=1 Tax=Solidesulfovibrio sp. TaxID=2910990 RepID=UPI002601A012|nr:DegT/DnrJ/EryC1/StrS family aminotransferase [Solidesulfovibrio sp.]